MTRSLRILHLEDSRLDADLTAKHLSSFGLNCQIQRVENREDYVRALRNGTFDLILADYSLPDFNGQLALELARELSVSVPFIFVSGVLGEEVAIDSLRQGATDYVLKHRLERLGPAIRRALAEQEGNLARVRAEAALRDSEFRYRLLVESVQEYALLMTDTDGIVTLWNKGAERLFGFTETEMIGHSVRRLLGIGEATTPDAALEFRTALLNQSQFEQWLVRSDGTKFWAGGDISTIRATDGRVKGYATVVRDNTERKLAEEERTALLLREQAARAEAERRAAELTEVNSALSRSNAELEQFAYAASHDLQEPLRMVKSFTQMLGLRLGPNLDSKASEMLKFVEFGSERMQHLVDDLLSYSRVLHDRETSLEAVDLDLVLDRTLLYFTDQIERESAVIVREPLPAVMANGERIGLVLQNLLSNALKYRNSHTPSIKFTSTAGETEHTIQVEDNGIGFDPQYADRIFGLFKRLHRSDEYPGTGVGLALCKQIVEQSGGKIWAESKPGCGAKFSFTLPKASRNES